MTIYDNKIHHHNDNSHFVTLIFFFLIAIPVGSAKKKDKNQS